MAALVLDPSNEECLPLIARVFPGKSKQDLLRSGDAAAVAARLDTHIRSKSPEKRQRSDNGSSLPRYLDGIPDLKFAEISEELASSTAVSQEDYEGEQGMESVEKTEAPLDRKGYLSRSDRKQHYLCLSCEVPSRPNFQAKWLGSRLMQGTEACKSLQQALCRLANYKPS